MDCGINKQDMMTDIPNQYKRLPPMQIATQEMEEQAKVQNVMFQAYQRFREIEADSVYAIRAQGATELNISLLGHHITQELRKLHEVSGDAEKGLGEIIAQVKSIEQAAKDLGTLPMVVAALEILQKYKRAVSRFENLKRRYIPSIRCGSVCKFDTEGNGDMPPQLNITYAGHMPYCGPSFGLAHMHIIKEQIHKGTEEEDAQSSQSAQSAKSTPRTRGKGQKREAPGSAPSNPMEPDPGAGLFKRGTDIHKGVYRCPSDMPIDPPQGHSQSEVLDMITQAMDRLKKTETMLTGGTEDFTVPDNKDMAEAQALHQAETAAEEMKEGNAAKKAKGGASSKKSA